MKLSSRINIVSGKLTTLDFPIVNILNKICINGSKLNLSEYILSLQIPSSQLFSNYSNWLLLKG